MPMTKNEFTETNGTYAELADTELTAVNGGWHWGDNWGDEGYFSYKCIPV